MRNVLNKTTLILLASAAMSMSPPRQLEAAELKAETLNAWTAYVRATEQRIGRELASGRGFLALDFHPSGASERKAAISGGIPVAGMKTAGDSGIEIPVPSGMIHHWRGAVFIPGARLSDLLFRVQNPASNEIRQEDVLATRVLERGPDSLKLYLKLQRSKIVTVVYNTEHVVRYSRYSNSRAFSSSIATKIAELQDPNTTFEKEKPQGYDRGFLWRLNSYWRYEQMEKGVLVECESISLSRGIPAFIDFFARPLIDKVARESMQRTLASMRDRIVQSRSKDPGIIAGVTK